MDDIENIEERDILKSDNPVSIIDFIHDLKVDEHSVDTIMEAFKQLESLDYEKLPELVIDYCVNTPREIARTIRHFYLEYWLDRGGVHFRDRLIRAVISYFKSPNESEVVAALRTSWTIGYRDELLEHELKLLAGLENEPGGFDDVQGYALTVLANLGYPDKSSVTQMLKKRLDTLHKFTEPDCWTAKIAASPDMISALVQASEYEDSNAQFAAIQALLLLAERRPNLTSDVWKSFLSIDHKNRFLFESTAVKILDSGEVARHFISQLFDVYKKKSEIKNPRVPTSQILKANLHKQLEAIREVGKKLKIKDKKVLKDSAVTPTYNESSYQTLESLNKDSAWDIILRLGLIEAKSWLPEAMREERNFTLVNLAEISGYIQAFEAIGILGRLVQDETLDYRYGLGCVKALAMLPSDYTIEVLLNNKVHNQKWGDGHIYSGVVEALSAVCISLQSCEIIWNKLRDRDTDQVIRKICAYTIQDLSSFLKAPLPQRQELVGFMKESYDKPEIFDSLLATLHRYFDEPEILEFLQTVAETEYQSSKLTEALASSGLLLKYPERLQKLGFRRDKKGWALEPTSDSLAAFALYCLYRYDESFEPAVIKLINDARFFSSPSNQVILNLKKTDRVSKDIKKSILKRALKFNGPNSTDTYTLEAAARVFPDGLLNKKTVSEVFNWHSGARYGFLESLKQTVDYSKKSRKVADIFNQFIPDKDRAVRRLAGRLLRDINPKILEKTVTTLANESSDLHNAVFMLDAAYYLDDITWNRIEKLGAKHRESLVRNLARSLSSERKNTLLANNYADDLLKSKDLLSTWHLGQAILDLGNEEVASKIYDNLPEEVYIRSYLIDLARKIDKNMEKLRRDEDKKFVLSRSI